MILIYNIIMILCFLFSLYFVIIGLFAFKSSKKSKKVNKKHKYAILIPCRNEEKVISNLLDSLKKQNYPKNNFDIYVVLNNCTDKTKDIALKKNVKIIEADIEVKSKGEALKYTFNYLKSKNYDAYVIFDADNVVDKNFLNAMNDKLNDGFLVVQGFRDAKNPQDNYLSGGYTMFYYLQNVFYNLSRMNIQKSSAINGTGFLIKKEVIDKYGFDVKTLTEDSELTGLCAINNIKIGFAIDAITYDEHPTNFKTSWIQRKRWSSGCYMCLKLYKRALFKGLWQNNALCSFDALLYYLAPIIQVISFVLPLLMCLLKFIKGLIINTLIIDFSSIYFLIIFYFISIIINIITLKKLNKKLKDYYKGIFGFYIFIISWIPINILCLFKKTKTWVQIEHNKNIPIENILN